jgi:hypothetical protein
MLVPPKSHEGGLVPPKSHEGGLVPPKSHEGGLVPSKSYEGGPAAWMASGLHRGDVCPEARSPEHHARWVAAGPPNIRLRRKGG